GGAGEAVPPERRAEAERGVERSGLDAIGGGVAFHDLDAVGKSGAVDAAACLLCELGRTLDPDDVAAETRSEQRRRSGFAACHVEHAIAGTEAHSLAEREDLVDARRVLELVVALCDRVVPRHAP